MIIGSWYSSQIMFNQSPYLAKSYVMTLPHVVYAIPKSNS